jgi:hypothetical protein
MDETEQLREVIKKLQTTVRRLEGEIEDLTEERDNAEEIAEEAQDLEGSITGVVVEAIAVTWRDGPTAGMQLVADALPGEHWPDVSHDWLSRWQARTAAQCMHPNVYITAAI